MTNSSKQLRLRLRARRRALSRRARRAAALAVTRSVVATGAFARSRRIGVYWPMDGELDTRPLLALLISRGKSAYLPGFAGCRPGEMRWRPFIPGAPLRRLRFGVVEPVAPRASLNPRYLDLVITPLVAFDVDGNRLGMGGGYYDRCFSFLKASQGGPVLIGVGYEFQRLEHIDPKPWDVPLSKVITERGVYARGSGLNNGAP